MVRSRAGLECNEAARRKSLAPFNQRGPLQLPCHDYLAGSIDRMYLRNRLPQSMRLVIPS